MKLNDVVKKYKNESEFIDSFRYQLVKLGAENPDFVYNPNQQMCHYNSGAENGPECKGCIIGQALQNMGWNDPDELANKSTVDDLFNSLIRSDFMSEDSVFNAVQNYQDSGFTWGKAIQPLFETT